MGSWAEALGTTHLTKTAEDAIRAESSAINPRAVEALTLIMRVCGQGHFQQAWPVTLLLWISAAKGPITPGNRSRRER